MDVVQPLPPSSPTPVAPPCESRPPVRVWPRTVQTTLVVLVTALLVGLLTHTLLHGSVQRPSGRTDEAPLVRLDLNRATHAQLRLLPGVGAKLADSIESYRHDKGPFKSIDELRKVEGIGPLTIERLRPWLCVTTTAATSASEGTVALMNEDAPQSAKPSRSGTKEVALSEPINLNTASVHELQKLPGIGPTLSQRIVEARTKDAFKSVEELRRVRGIGPKTLAKVRPYVVVDGVAQ